MVTSGEPGRDWLVRLGPGDEPFRAAEGETVLDAGRRAGIDLPHACRGGRCGLCAARLLEGRCHYPAGEPAALELRAVPDDRVLLCRAHAMSDLTLDIRPIRAAGGGGPRRLPARIASIETLAPDLRRVLLKLPRAEPFAFRAGQYLDILTADGERRSYSIASAPEPGLPVELHIRRGTPGGVGARLFDGLAPAGLLEIEGPFGDFAFDAHDPARPLVLVAGGTGFAPVRAILYAALAAGEFPVFLYRGARNADELYDHDALQALVRDSPRLRYVAVLSEQEALPPLRAGWLHEAVSADFAQFADASFYAAGPPPMLKALRDALSGRGLSAARFHSDLPAT